MNNTAADRSSPTTLLTLSHMESPASDSSLKLNAEPTTPISTATTNKPMNIWSRLGVSNGCAVNLAIKPRTSAAMPPRLEYPAR
jgi:hypothetical protein